MSLPYFESFRMCEIQVRCEGAALYGDQKICTKCAKHLAEKSKPKALRGSKKKVW